AGPGLGVPGGGGADRLAARAARGQGSFARGARMGADGRRDFAGWHAALPVRVPAWLKWPNDVQVDGEKLAGILVELVPAPPANPGAVASRPDGANKGPGLVIGFGLNVHTAAADLPPGATSLAVLAGRGAGCLVGTAADQGDGPALAG